MGEEETPLLGVPDRKGEHPAQFMDAVRPLFLVEMHDDLGVAPSREAVTPIDEPLHQIAVVINLAVEDEVVAALLIADRLAAALHSGATHVVATPSYLFDTLEMASTTSLYPLEEFNDYLRLHPDRSDEVAAILGHFNLRWHAPAITAETLLLADHESGIYSPGALADLAAGIAGEVTVHESERSSFKDGLFTEKWLTEKLIGKGAEPIVPEHWQSYV